MKKVTQPSKCFMREVCILIDIVLFWFIWMLFEKSDRVVRWKFQVEVSNGLLDHSTVSNLHADDHWQFESWDLQVGTYHATSLLVASRAPPPGVVSRGIGLEGLTSFLAGLWGTGAGASTLTENVHTIAVTKMGSRWAVEFGACVLILAAVVGEDFISYCPQS